MLFYILSDLAVKSLQVIHKDLQATWASAGHAVQIEILNTGTRVTRRLRLSICGSGLDCFGIWPGSCLQALAAGFFDRTDPCFLIPQLDYGSRLGSLVLIHVPFP